MIDTEAYLASIADITTSYYGNGRRNIDNTAIAGEMWKSPDSWMVPYSRGAMYFADLDARVRARSDGKVTLVTMLRELRDRGRAYDTMLKGQTVFPVAGAFGPCVVAVPDRLGVLDLLYRTAPRSNVITEVLAGSNAEQAGLRVGDRLAANTLVLPSIRDRTRPIDLRITRDGKPMTISYVPRTNKTVEARRWSRAPAAQCHQAPE